MSVPAGKRIVIGIYFHPEAYPPTLNAIREISSHFSEIILIYRPHLNGNWEFPANVKKIPSGDSISSADQQKVSTAKKFGFFYQFLKDFRRACKKYQPDTILLYDSIPLLAYSLVKPLLKHPHKLWYHNHDIAELDRLRKYSIGWFAARTEQKFFSKIDLFTLPAASRKQYFPIAQLKGECIVVANYPARYVYEPFYRIKKIEEKVILVFQGMIGEGHGFETIIAMLKDKIKGKQLKLVLKGYCDEEYKSQLIHLAKTHQVEEHLSFAGFGPYKEVPQVASTCHIGIGIFTKKEVMHLTLGTSSNKLYEYAAVGLPVLYTDEPHFSEHLGKFKWAFPVSDEATSIRTQIESIIDNYTVLSAAAHESFTTELNFENQFKPVLNWLNRN